METGLNAFKEALHLKHVEAGEYSPLALAYIGDAVYELAIRTLVMNRGNMQRPWAVHQPEGPVRLLSVFFCSHAPSTPPPLP